MGNINTPHCQWCGTPLTEKQWRERDDGMCSDECRNAWDIQAEEYKENPGPPI